MNRTKNHWAMGVATVSVLFGVQSALAGVPLVEMTIEVSDGFVSTFNPAGTDNGDGTFNYAGFVSSGMTGKSTSTSTSIRIPPATASCSSPAAIPLTTTRWTA